MSLPRAIEIVEALRTRREDGSRAIDHVNVRAFGYIDKADASGARTFIIKARNRAGEKVGAAALVLPDMPAEHVALKLRGSLPKGYRA